MQGFFWALECARTKSPSATRWHPNTQALAEALAENVEAGLRGKQSEEIEAQCNQHEHDVGCDKGGIPKIEESTATCETNLENLPSSMEEVTTIPELEQHGVPNGRVFIRKKLKGKFPIKGRMKNKKKAIRRFIGVLTPPFEVLKPYNKTNNKGETHRRIDVIKDINGKIAQLSIQISGDYAGGIVTYIDDISKPRKQRKTKDAKSIGERKSAPMSRPA